MERVVLKPPSATLQMAYLRPALAVNDVVLVKDDNLPPMKWPLARIMELIPGRDEVARVAGIRTSSGTTKRAVSKLSLLALKDELPNWGRMSGQAAAATYLIKKV